MSLLFELIAAHFIADFVLQPDVMGKGKNRDAEVHQQHNVQYPPWGYWLAAHAFTHGLAVYLLTQSLLFGLLETALHAIIDFAKCEKKLTVHQDQALHIACKVGYWAILIQASLHS